MKILALNDDEIGGGAAQLFQRTNAILRQAGHEVIAVTGDSIEPARPANRIRRELQTNLRQLHHPALLGYLAELLAKHPVEIAHVHNVHDRLSPQVFPFLKRRGIPIVYQVNDYHFFCNTHYAYNWRLDQPCKRCLGGNAFWAFRYGCVNYVRKGRADQAVLQGLTRLGLQMTKPWRAVDLFLVTSQQAAALLSEWGVDASRQYRIFNAVRMEEFEGPSTIGEEIVFYGASLRNKGVDTFLSALEYLEPGSRIGVYLIGLSPDLEARLRACAERRHLQVRIDSSVRWQNGLRGRVASARAVVVPSQWWVTSENVVYEAMLLGKPVIVSRMGGNAELVEHGKTGFLFEPRNGQELAKYMNLLSSDRALAEDLGRTAGARSRERFAETQLLKRLGGAYARAQELAGR